MDAMEDVLRELKFEPVDVLKLTHTFEEWFQPSIPLYVVQYECNDNGLWAALQGVRYTILDSPAHLRRIVEAEQRCAAAWRGEPEAKENH